MYKPEFIFTLLLVTSVKFCKNQPFTSVLPIGEYEIDVLKIVSCPSNLKKNNKLQINLYLSKVSATSSEFKGNVTINTIPYDDNLYSLNINLDTKDSKGRWTPSFFVVKKEKACTALKSFIKTQYLDDFGWNGTCPILPGVYVTPGFPATNMEKAVKNIPKVAPYGTYKLRVSVTNKNDNLYTCIYAIIDVKRPQEKP